MLEKWNNKSLFKLIWPLIIEQLLAVTMGAADTVMIASVGEHAVSGVNIVDNINNLLIIVFVALCTGGSVVVSQFIGRRDKDNASLAAKQLLYTVTLMSVLMMLVTLFFRRPIISVIYGSIDRDVMDSALIYFLLTGISYPFLAVYNANAAIFRSSGNSRTPMFIALFVNIVNIAGNAIFIFGFRIGVAGAGLSTLISRVLASIITLVLLYKGHAFPISLEGLWRVKFQRHMIRNILNVGVPSGLESSMFQFGRLATQRILPTFGTAAMAGNAIAGVINSFSFMPGMACGMALTTVVGQSVGAGDYHAAKKLTAKLMKLSYIIMITISGAILLCLDPLIQMFHLSGESAAFARQFLEIHCFSMMIGWPVSFALPNALRAAGDARYVMWVATISMWIVRVSLAYVLAYPLGIGPLGVWLAMGADFISRGSFYTVRWLRGKWMTKRVI
jgi:putative MATE family efflux protein